MQENILSILPYIASFVPHIIIILAIVFAVKRMSRGHWKRLTQLAKIEPKVLLQNNIHKEAVNKDYIVKEFAQVQEIKKVKFKKPTTANVTSNQKQLELLVINSQGIEEWFLLTLKQNKIYQLEKTYKPITL